MINFSKKGNKKYQPLANVLKRNKSSRILREINMKTTHGKTIPEAANQSVVSDKSYCRWRKIYGGLKVDQAKRFKEIEAQNTRLKKLVAELS